MTAPRLFTPDGYRDLLGAVRAGGYRFSDIGEAPEVGCFYLRHDVDKHVGWALEMAAIEADLGVRSTYFFLLRSPLYSPLEPQARAQIRRIRALGHAVGLHCDERRMPEGPNLDARVRCELALLDDLVGGADAVVSFHNPSPEVLRREPDGYRSAYAPAWFPPRLKYLSDSNMLFREGDPRPDLRARRWPALQMLVHPIWHLAGTETPLPALERCLAQRREELDAYLRYSNHVWRESRETD